MKPDDAGPIRRERWVGSYRLAHRGADRWASSPSGVRHSVETQERIFRMAEQLRERRDWPNAAPLFPVLKAVDDVASWEIGPNQALTPGSASAAGARRLQDPVWQVAAGSRPRLARGLRD